MSDPGGVGETVNILEVLFGDFKRTSSDIGDVLSDQLAGIDCGLVDLLEKEGSEWLDTRAQKGAVEGDVDTTERNGSKATFQYDRLRLRLCLLYALMNYLDKMRFDIVKGHLLHKCLDVDFLRLQHVEQVCQAVKSTKLRKESQHNQ